MKIELRLKQVEKASGPGTTGFIRRPADVPKAISRRAMEQLGNYSSEMLHPWTSLQDLAESCRTSPLSSLKTCPGPIFDVVFRAKIEAVTGDLWPDWLTAILVHLDNLADTPHATLIEYLRMIDADEDNYCLPLPYSVEVLRQIAEPDVLPRCLDFADRLRRGEITTAVHAAELAKLLPPITRADQEKAWRAFMEQALPAHLQTSSVPAAGAGNG